MLDPIEHTRRWISSMVIGLNLCPFAERVFKGDKIRYVLSPATDEVQLLAELARELDLLASTPIAIIETTLLIHPLTLADFLDYNDFVGAAEGLVADLGLEGTIQVASFHPRHQFAETEPDAPENYTNRSPYPMFHLLREESVTEVAGDPDALLEIPLRNIETLNALGAEKILERLQAIAEAGG